MPVSTDLPVSPPVPPMLARLSREMPRDGYLYEPKWDGFRCLAYRSGGSVDLRSRNDRPLGRYFPELVDALGMIGSEPFVLDGEIVVPGPGGLDFTTLLTRLHPAATRVERLAAEAPAWLVAFDLLACDGADLRGEPFGTRREQLVRLLAGAGPPIRLSLVTTDPDVAGGWIAAYAGAGIDGVVAKHPELRYEPGRRAMVKVKPLRTARCVVAGARLLADRPLPSSLLLGLYEGGELRHIGLASGFSLKRRHDLLERIVPLETSIHGHPWEHGFLVGGSPMGRLPGAAAGWTPELSERDWIPLAPRLVCEVRYEQVDEHRLRHPARFRGWIPAADPHSCTLDQLDPAPGNPRLLLEAA
jgi:ATP-dependent DNA ligase